ncbi:hypothetical protein MED193_08273 [Roseobacter sp. MED193]|uniref:BRO-N domain-containing protein n=1 Tax=Roseobacter sp. MED193 TaxID=314262 RepID=UPI000068E021|nr:BRO family protein [Roseobacter sp. MED193]EAQ45634.1 hypothetical protein MED193_08273 [Roseobacter sp. MED193]
MTRYGVPFIPPEPAPATAPARVEPEGEPEVSTYDFNGLSLRVVQIDGEPWFVAIDALKTLGISRHGGVLNPLNEDEKTMRGRTSLGLGHGRPINLISESGLYKLITRSDKPEAKPFQEWVTRDVLPSVRLTTIRKTGSYSLTDSALSMAS